MAMSSGGVVADPELGPTLRLSRAEDGGELYPTVAEARRAEAEARRVEAEARRAEVEEQRAKAEERRAEAEAALAACVSWKKS